MIANVRLWGRTVGAVALEPGEKFSRFEFDSSFLRSGVEISPLRMPLRRGVFSFPELPFEAFHGLPGLLSDSLPDKFGNELIDTWLASQGRLADEFDAVQRLCYTGTRGMGALEFVPALGPDQDEGAALQIEALVELASQVLGRRSALTGSFADDGIGNSMADILRVGTSAGGARAKAVIAWNPVTNEVRSGQIDAASGFSYWLLKFDGVTGNRDKELEDPLGYGAIEYAYYLMATAAGIEMNESRLLEENGRRHFMTKRFDRDGGDKIHMQSLAALCHFDFNSAGSYGYEQAFFAMRSIGIGSDGAAQMFRRMAFNVVARNQDDHVKNIAFLMNRSGTWRLAPAFDMTYSYNPSGLWTASHQMTVNGKRDGFTRDDFRAAGAAAILKRGAVDGILDEVLTAVSRWTEFAAAAGVPEGQSRKIGAAHRTAEFRR